MESAKKVFVSEINRAPLMYGKREWKPHFMNVCVKILFEIEENNYVFNDCHMPISANFSLS